MIYIVECALSNEQTDEDWELWYNDMKPPRTFLSKSGWQTVQRFKGITEMPPAYFGLYSLDSVEFLTSPSYKNKGGGKFRTDRWQPVITFWHRDLFDGLDRAPAVPVDSLLAVADASNPRPLPEQLGAVWARAVGLDKSTPFRALAVVDAAKAQLWQSSLLRGFRLFKPRIEQLVVEHEA